MFEEGLAELHTHLGGSVASDIMWSLAHEQGIALPTRDFWEFDRLVTVSDPRGVPDLDSLDRIYHLTELIQSSPLAVERSVHAAIGGAYRSQRITTLELRFNPMKRNRGGERDLDHIILAAIRGLDRASLEYPQVRAGLILMMDRTFTPEQNLVIVEKALRYAARGVVGVDIAGPRPNGARYDYTQIREHVSLAQSGGLGVTIHVGEEGGDLGVAELAEVVEVAAARPDRPRHPRGAGRRLMATIREAGVTLEICPTSNLLTKALADEAAVRDTFRAFIDHGVPFTIATDGPEMMRTHLRDEFELLLRIGALDEERAPGSQRARPRGLVRRPARSSRLAHPRHEIRHLANGAGANALVARPMQTLLGSSVDHRAAAASDRVDRAGPLERRGRRRSSASHPAPRRLTAMHCGKNSASHGAGRSRSRSGSSLVRTRLRAGSSWREPTTGADGNQAPEAQQPCSRASGATPTVHPISIGEHIA